MTDTYAPDRVELGPDGLPISYLPEEHAPYDDEFTAGAGSGVGRLQKMLAGAQETGTIDGELTEQELAQIGADVVRDWNRDRDGNKQWREKAEKSLNAAAQEKAPEKNYPFPGASNVQYPLLTVAGQQFAARAYPAIVKGDEAIQVKTFGKDTSGRKAERAERVKTFLNYQLFYRVDDWESDTDSMLHQLPILGTAFRKIYYDPIARKPCVEFVSPLRLTVPKDARSLKTAPRITHDYDRYPYEIAQLQRSGVYRKVTLDVEAEDDQASRVLLEQHRMMDLDDDGLEEPYIVTVDASTEQVLRIEPDYAERDVQMDDEGLVLAIERPQHFVKFPFLPDPKGRFYDIGFGHLLSPIMDVLNTIINLQIDAGHAQVAGGGFIASELRLQGAGQGGSIKFRPAEYKTVNATGAELRNAIYERTFPGPSPVLFQLLGMLMEAAKDIASVNDAITGDAARSAPVGTTLALIEQGLQVFSAIYKRIYRALREEYTLFAKLCAEHGDPAEYAKLNDLDGPQPSPMGHNGGPPMEGAPPEMGPPPTPAQLQELYDHDFAEDDLDIRPIADPTAVTKMQQLQKAQYVLQFVGKGVINDKEAMERAFEAAGIENIEALWPQEQAGPPPGALEKQALELAGMEADNNATTAKTHETVVKTAAAAAEAGLPVPTTPEPPLGDQPPAPPPPMPGMMG